MQRTSYGEGFTQDVKAHAERTVNRLHRSSEAAMLVMIAAAFPAQFLIFAATTTRTVPLWAVAVPLAVTVVVAGADKLILRNPRFSTMLRRRMIDRAVARFDLSTITMFALRWALGPATRDEELEPALTRRLIRLGVDQRRRRLLDHLDGMLAADEMLALLAGTSDTHLEALEKVAAHNPNGYHHAWRSQLIVEIAKTPVPPDAATVEAILALRGEWNGGIDELIDIAATL